MQSPEGLENTPYRVNIKNDEIFFSNFETFSQFLNFTGKCDLTQLPISFQTWSEFKNKCGKSEEISNNPTAKTTVKLGLKPTKILKVDPDQQVIYHKKISNLPR